MVAGFAGCGWLFAADGTVAPPASETQLADAVALSSAAFATDLYAQLHTRPGNLAFAPLGLMQALLPVAAGAGEGTHEEFVRALHLSVPVPEAADGLAALARRLQDDAGGADNLDFAYALWVRDSLALRPEYVDFLWQRSRSELRGADFGRSDVAAQWMNRWISDRTGGRIARIADERILGPATCLVAGSAVYFEAEWLEGFDPQATAPAAFHRKPERAAAPAASLTAGTSQGALTTAEAEPARAAGADEKPVEVPMMHRVGALRLAALPGVRLVEIPFRGDRLAMVVALPAEGTPLAEVEAALVAGRLTEWMGAVKKAELRQIDLQLPRFKAAEALPDLGAVLAAAGLRAAFDPGGAADFTLCGMDLAGAPLHLSGVTHRLKFSLTEHGARAAATTATPAAEPQYDRPVELPTSFQVNRPFLYWVGDRQSGCVLLLGRVVDPGLD